MLIIIIIIIIIIMSLIRCKWKCMEYTNMEIHVTNVNMYSNNGLHIQTRISGTA